MDKILKVAKRLKAFTLEDIVMFCEVDTNTAETFLQKSESIKLCGNKLEYVEIVKTEDKFKVMKITFLVLKLNMKNYMKVLT